MRRFLLAISILFVMFCSGAGRLTGTSNETQTGKPTAMVGLIVYSDSLPVNDAAVNLYDQNTIKKIVMPLQKLSALIRNGQTKTNINGFFRFDSVDTGKYYVEVNDHDTLGALLEATVHENDTIVQVNGVLKRTGSIEGKIDSGLIGKNGTTYIYVTEVQKQVAVDSTGAFVIKDLPPYNYSLQVIHDSIVVKSSFDTTKVIVREGDTAYIGSFPPQALIGVDTIAGIAPCIIKIFYKVSDPDKDTVSTILNYGDGKIDNLSKNIGNLSHEYVDTGIFKIMLIANDGKGGTGTDSVAITIHKNNLPLAQVLADTSSGISPLAIKINYKASDADGNLLYEYLNYADGKIDTLTIAEGSKSHIYSDSGTYKIVLTAIDSKGGIGTDSVVIKVKESIPSVPKLISPINGAVNQSVSLPIIFNKASHASFYYLQVAIDSGFSTIVFSDSMLIDTGKTISNLINDATYYWRVKSRNSSGNSTWSSYTSFTTIVAAPQSPTPTLPPDGAMEQPISTVLTWHKVLGVPTYCILVSLDSGFTNIIKIDSALADTSEVIAGLSNGTAYFWHVKAKNIGGSSIWSLVRSFTTIVSPPVSTTLSSPVNGISGSTLSPNLTWSMVPGATTYHVQVSTENTFINLVAEDSILTSAVKTITGLANNTVYYWRVQAKNAGGVSSWTFPWSFTTIVSVSQIPTLISPTNGTTGQSLSPTLSWSNVNGATTYHLQVSANNAFTTILLEDSTLTTPTKTINSIMNASTYYWRVLAKNAGGVSNWTTQWSFTTIIAAPSTPTLTIPLDGAIGQSVSPTLTWSGVNGAATYHVQVSTFNTFSTILVEDSVLTSTIKTITGLANNTVYYWRVQAKNAGGVSNWTSPWSFTTIVAAPQTPVLSLPGDGITDQPLNPTLSWLPVNGASTYHIQVSTNNSFSNVILEDSTLSITSKLIAGLTNSTGYYWRVSAKNAGGTSLWSSPLSFTTIIAAPSTPTLTQPLDGAIGQSVSPTLTWSTVNEATTYHLQVSTNNTFSTIIMEDSTLTSEAKVLAGLANNSVCFWRVKTKNNGGSSNWSSPWSLTTIIAAPQMSTLISPADGVAGLPISPILTWSGVSGAATYHLQVSTVNTFATVLIEDSVLVSASKALSGLAKGTQYYWRVLVKNAGGISSWTSPWSFSTVIAAPQTPTLTSPTDGVTGQSLSPTLSWSIVNTAATYHIQVSTTNTFATILIEDSMLTSAAKVLTGLANNTTFYWRVSAKNAGGVSDWPSPWSLTTIHDKIAFDKITDGGTVSDTFSTFSHACAGENRILFVGIRGDVTNDMIMRVTYNGTTMVLADKGLDPGDRFAYLYYLKNPDLGEHAVRISASSSILISAVAMSYNGALQTGGLDATNKVIDNGFNSSLTVSLNTTVDNCWVVGMFQSTANATAGINTILRSDGVSLRPHMCDNNGATLLAGPVNLTLDWLPNPKRSMGIIASFAPIP